MSTTGKKVITSQSELRANKLKNKRTQLENLLRSRERLDYEIKTLKKSIAKDVKVVQHEAEVLTNLLDAEADSEMIQEAVELQEGEDPRKAIKSLLKTIKLSDEEIYLIVKLLLAFAETL